MPDPSNEAVLRTENLGRSVGDKGIVSGITITVNRGELVAIVGPSGAGKSSLLRLLNRLDEPTEGTVWLNGVDYRTIAPRDLRRQVGMVMQRAFLFPGTVAANVRYGPNQRGVTLSDDAVESLLAGVGLSGFALRTVEALSGGEAQRVSIARTLANDPCVVLMDEPTSALDEALKRQIEELIEKIVRERSLTCLVVTHDTQSAARIADRIIALERGKVRAIGTVPEVLQR